MWFKSRRARLGLLAVLVGTSTFCTVNAPSSGTAPYPGLPDVESSRDWLGTGQVGVTESVKARQRARLPLTIVAAAYRWESTQSPAPDGGILQSYRTIASSFLVSPRGSDHPYGIAAPLVVRTVAFGSIPVLATIEVEQRRDETGLPVPIVVTSDQRTIGSERTEVDAVVLDDELSTKITRLEVDGVQIDLPHGGCATRARAHLHATSEPYSVPNGAAVDRLPWFDSTKNFLGQSGGTLTGTIDIPDFKDCYSSSGDNVGPVLSASVSGKDNPVKIRIGATVCFTLVASRTLPPAPGEDTPSRAHCQPAPYPENPGIPPAYSLTDSP